MNKTHITKKISKSQFYNRYGYVELRFDSYYEFNLLFVGVSREKNKIVTRLPIDFDKKTTYYKVFKLKEDKRFPAGIVYNDYFGLMEYFYD